MLLLNILSQQVTPDICQKLKQDQARGRRMPASPEVVAMFFAGGISESLRSWFTGGKKRSEEDSKKTAQRHHASCVSGGKHTETSGMTVYDTFLTA